MGTNEDLEKSRVENFRYVMGCLHRLNLVYDELSTLYKKRQGKEYYFVSQHTFRMLHMGLKYTFICEYCKLLERCGNRKESNWGSLAKLNEATKAAHTDYKNYDTVNSKINVLQQSKFHLETIRVLRDKNFAHLDETGEPFKVTAFTDDEFTMAKLHINEMIEILNLCGQAMDTEYIIKMNDDSTERFIEKYAKFYETREEMVNRVLGKN